MNEYMKIANELAKENIKTNNGGPFGAVIVKDGKVIGKGNNHVVANNDPTAHAEVMAIRSACKNLNTFDLSGCEIYTNCYPCPMCMSAIIWANIKKVYYGNTKFDAENIGFRDNIIYNFFENKESCDIVLEQVDRACTLEAFDMYANKADKTMY